MKRKEEVLDTLRRLKPLLENRYGIESLALFGSFARDEATENSDVDLAIVSIREKSLMKRLAAKRFLEKHLQRSVDLGYLDTMHRFIRHRIGDEMIYV